MQQTTAEREAPLPEYPVLDSLFCGLRGGYESFWTEAFPEDSPESKAAFDELQATLDKYAPEYAANCAIMDVAQVYALEYKRVGFLDGIRVAMMISDDLERLRRDMGRT